MKNWAISILLSCQLWKWAHSFRVKKLQISELFIIWRSFSAASTVITKKCVEIWTSISIIEVMERIDIKVGLSDDVCHVIHSNEVYCSGRQLSVLGERRHTALRSCMRPLFHHQCRSSIYETYIVVHMRRHFVFSCISPKHCSSFIVASKTHETKTVRIIFFYFSSLI